MCRFSPCVPAQSASTASAAGSLATFSTVSVVSISPRHQMGKVYKHQKRRWKRKSRQLPETTSNMVLLHHPFLLLQLSYCSSSIQSSSSSSRSSWSDSVEVDLFGGSFKPKSLIRAWISSSLGICGLRRIPLKQLMHLLAVQACEVSVATLRPGEVVLF